jgi:methyl-accepting chemotaxis protein
MAHVAEQISTGDLRVNVAPQSDHDTLGTAFALMVANLQQLTAELANATNLLSATATEIVATTAQLATSATATATSMTETSTTVEQVRHTADRASHQATAVATGAQQAVQISQSGQQSTAANLAGMVHIRQQMDSITASMSQLSEQTEAIGQLIATVDDIAAQSNLLAVNAAIESAQAGEHGKGFAVVAQEISSLAEQSKQATRQVRRLLADIQQAATAARRATDQGAQAVAAGLEQSQHAGETIKTLAGRVAAAAQSATEIAVSSRQQLTGMDQLATAMTHVQQASTRNVASVQQLEASAHSLSALGEKLRAVVGQYKA